MDGSGTLVMLPRDAPTDVLNELQLVQEFYGADVAADHQRVMALFAPHAQLDLPQMHVSGRDAISAVMFYAKTLIADIDIEPYMVEVSPPGGAGGGGGGGYGGHNAASTAPTSSTTSTDSTSSTCTSAATSRRRRPGSGRPPRAPSAGASNAAATAAAADAAAAVAGRPRPLGRGKQQATSDAHPRTTRARGGGGTVAADSDATQTSTDQFDTTMRAANGAAGPPRSMSRTHVYAVATITPKSLARMITLNLLPREIRLRTRVTLVWDDEAGEVLLLRERPDNLPVWLVPSAVKRALGSTLGAASTLSQRLLGRLARTRLVAARWPGLARMNGTGL